MGQVRTRCIVGGLGLSLWLIAPSAPASEADVPVPPLTQSAASPALFSAEHASPFGPRPAAWSYSPSPPPVEQAAPPVDLPTVFLTPTQVAPPPTSAYNPTKSTMTWLAGGDDRFGAFSLESHATLEVGPTWGIVTGSGFHFLNGPVQTDMPPRLFDFTIGLARRELVQPNFGYDFAFRVGAFSDFEGSARKGVRYPGHAVAFLRLDPTSELVLGIDYLDRDDISLLPVAGLVLTPSSHVRLEAVFPRPRLAVQVMNSARWIYLAGELGGGTWAIERVDLTDDNATYRDLRLVLGLEHKSDGHPSTALEIGYVFDRELSYRTGVGDYHPKDMLMLRSLARY